MEEIASAHMAVFPSDQYAADKACQKAMREVAEKWDERSASSIAIVSQFHPLSIESLKAPKEADVQILQPIGGIFTEFI